MASWWSAIHGYNHPELNAAVHRQIDCMSHVMFGGLTHAPAIDLCKRLVAMTPQPLQQVFLVDSGSVAVEVAIKMAIQYQFARGFPHKHRLLTVKRGYHGDTFATMAVCDPSGMHEMFAPVLSRHLFAEAPACRYDEAWDESAIKGFEGLIAAHHHELAAVILEPVVQGAGGMRFYSPVYLARVRQLCDRYDVLLIADEIATGFGRTGSLFACEKAEISPDIMCLGKALTGGYLTLAAALCTLEVSRTISENSVLMHGPTFMGNPLACKVACASLDILARNSWKNQVADIAQGLERGLSPCREFRGVQEVRVLGAIGVVELKKPVDMTTIQPRFVAEGIWVRPFGRLVYVMPPYIIGCEELTLLCRGICRVLEGIAG
jgi:adenosylmethionine-8-amino-7-oxononanoate aminotransferase